MSILIEAYFRICPGCRREGVITWPDGNQSLWIHSKEAGLQAVGTFLDSEQISIECALFLIEQIEKSPLDVSLGEKDAHWVEVSRQVTFDRLMYYCKKGLLMQEASVFPVTIMSHVEQ